MAKQKGLVKLNGTIDGLNFYTRKGVAVVRKAGGGFSGERIKNSPEMVRVRENGSEFGMVSSFNKRFKDLLFPFFGSYRDTTLHGRLMSLFQAVKVCDTVSVRGERKVGVGLSSVEGKLLLQRFGFTTESVQRFFPGKMVYDAVHFSLEVMNFDAGAIKFPPSASIMELQFGVLALDALHLPSEIFMSSSRYFDAQSIGGSFVMVPNVVPPTGGLCIPVVGVRFYEEVNGERYLLKTLKYHGVAVL